MAILLFGFKLGRRCIRYMTSNSGYIVSLLTSQMWRPFAKAESFSVWEQWCNHKWLNVVSVSQLCATPHCKVIQEMLDYQKAIEQSGYEWAWMLQGKYCMQLFALLILLQEP